MTSWLDPSHMATMGLLTGILKGDPMATPELERVVTICLGFIYGAAPESYREWCAPFAELGKDFHTGIWAAHEEKMQLMAHSVLHVQLALEEAELICADKRYEMDTPFLVYIRTQRAALRLMTFSALVEYQEKVAKWVLNERVPGKVDARLKKGILWNDYEVLRDAASAAAPPHAGEKSKSAYELLQLARVELEVGGIEHCVELARGALRLAHAIDDKLCQKEAGAFLKEVQSHVVQSQAAQSQAEHAEEVGGTSSSAEGSGARTIVKNVRYATSTSGTSGTGVFPGSSVRLAGKASESASYKLCKRIRARLDAWGGPAAQLSEFFSRDRQPSSVGEASFPALGVSRGEGFNGFFGFDIVSWAGGALPPSSTYGDTSNARMGADDAEPAGGSWILSKSQRVEFVDRKIRTHVDAAHVAAEYLALSELWGDLGSVHLCDVYGDMSQRAASASFDTAWKIVLKVTEKRAWLLLRQQDEPTASIMSSIMACVMDPVNRGYVRSIAAYVAWLRMYLDLVDSVMSQSLSYPEQRRVIVGLKPPGPGPRSDVWARVDAAQAMRHRMSYEEGLLVLLDLRVECEARMDIDAWLRCTTEIALCRVEIAGKNAVDLRRARRAIERMWAVYEHAGVLARAEALYARAYLGYHMCVQRAGSAPEPQLQAAHDCARRALASFRHRSRVQSEIDALVLLAFICDRAGWVTLRDDYSSMYVARTRPSMDDVERQRADDAALLDHVFAVSRDVELGVHAQVVPV